MLRRMRESWFYLLLAVPAVGIALGIQYYVRKTFPQSAGAVYGTALALKPSFFRPDSAFGTDYDKLRNIASAHHYQKKAGDFDKEPIPYASPKVARTIEKDPNAEDDLEEGGGSFTSDVADAEADELGGKKKGRKASGSSDAEGILDEGESCRALEYRGDGPTQTHFTEAEWGKVLSQFRQAKASLVEWIEIHRREFPDKTSSVLQQQIEKTKIQRPPAMEEPDLTWRGIGVWTRTSKNEPMIRIGGGFVKLAQKNAVRARFELTRLVAQGLSPCELQRVDGGDAWSPLLKCLGVDEKDACDLGSYSEGGWAVSSALATLVSPANCTIPAFRGDKIAACLKKVPLPLSTASAADSIGVSAAAPSREVEGGER